MPKLKINLIAAIGRNRELGKDNKLLWQIPADLAHFQKLTTNHAVVMGQKTYESIGQSLPNRLNIVLSKDRKLEIPEVAVCHDLDDAVQIALDYSDEIFIIGGGSVYAQTINLADKLYLTLVDADFAADIYFPEYEKNFKLTKNGRWQKTKNLKFKFTEWEKK